MRNYKDVIREELDKFEKEKHYPNIMLLGATGCGKSSLINRVFGSDVAYVSHTGRGTNAFDIYYGKDTGSNVNLIDSMGYEMGDKDSLKRYVSELRKWISEHQDTKDTIHLVWYCIQNPNASVQEYDAEVLKTILSVPTLKDKVAIVVTKCDQDDEDMSTKKAIEDEIHRLVSTKLDVMAVSTEPNLELDLDKLIEWSCDRLVDEDIKRMFISAQMISLKDKRKQAALIVSGAVVAAAATGAIPIPASDAPIITAEQIAMSLAVINCYGMNMAKSTVTTLVGNVAVSNLGKSAVGSLLKLIPGAGSVAGAIISASVAASITAALGASISEICYKCCKDIAHGKESLLDALDYQTVKQYMTEFLKLNGKKSPKQLGTIIETDAEEDD